MRRFLIAAALCAASAGAIAGETFTFAITGTRYCSAPNAGVSCGPGTAPWNTDLHFTTSSTADGSYAMSNGSLSNFIVDSWYFSLPDTYKSIVVTIQGGQVSSIDGPIGIVPFDTWQGSFSGMNVYLDTLAPRMGFEASWAGALAFVNAVPAVPEPQTYALMLGSLAAAGCFVRRRRHVTAAEPWLSPRAGTKVVPTEQNDRTLDEISEEKNF